MIEQHSLYLRLVDALSRYSAHTSKLRKYLSVFQKWRYTEFYYVEDDDDILVPSSVARWLLKDYPGRYVSMVNEILPQRPLNAPIRQEFPPRDQRQYNALAWSIENHKKTPIIMMCMDMGSGKTYCSLAHASALNTCAIIVCDQENLMLQWRAQALKFLNIDENNVEIITGREKLLNVGEGTRKPPYPKIVITSIQSITSLLKHHRTAFDQFAMHIGAGLLIVDEAHENFGAVVNMLCHSKICRAELLTGTPERSNFKSNYSYEKAFANAPKYIDAGVVSPDKRHLKTIVVSWNSGILNQEEEKSMFKTQHGFNLAKYTDWMVNESGDRFCKALFKIMDIVYLNRNPKPEKLAVVAKTNQAVDFIALSLKHWLSANGLNASVGRYCGLVDSKQRPLELSCDIVVANDKTLGKAIDIPNLEVLINVIPFSSSPATKQLAKRLRPNPDPNGLKRLMVDFLDVSSSSCKRSFAKRRSIYNDISKEVFEVNT